MPKIDQVLLTRARSMRREQTPTEQRLWFELRAKRFKGVKFSRQVVIGTYIADFVARSKKLIIEVDGETHAEGARDHRRTAWLTEQGYRVIRFTNHEIGSNLEGALSAIGAALAAAPLPDPLPGGERES